MMSFSVYSPSVPGFAWISVVKRFLKRICWMFM